VRIDRNIFREYDIRGVVGDQLDDATVATLARAIGTYISLHRSSADPLRNPTIAVGWDARASSPGFAEIFGLELNATGCDVLSIGQVPTPVLYYATHVLGVDGGVMITGSHNPPDHNGFKISLGTQSLFGGQIREIGELALRGRFRVGGGSVRAVDIMGRYVEQMPARVKLGPRRLKVVLDAGNGMGGVTAVPIYRALGVDVVELYTEPDSAFPNHHPDPTEEKNLTDLIAAVKYAGADLGVAFDGDADRIGVVDEKGGIVRGDMLTTVFARDVLRDNPGATVIGEAKCSQTLFDEIARLGGRPLMWKAGHSIIKAKIKESGAVLAGEMSGHVFFADRYFGFDDAAYAGARLLEILSNTDRTLSSILAEMPSTFATPEIRTECPDEQKFEVVDRVVEHFRAAGREVSTIDGARITFENGWGIVRPSNTQAILVSRFEADSDDALAAIRDEVEAAVRRYL
jgi:phosphomannomutase/phosphoglucomutase